MGLRSLEAIPGVGTSEENPLPEVSMEILIDSVSCGENHGRFQCDLIRKRIDWANPTLMGLGSGP